MVYFDGDKTFQPVMQQVDLVRRRSNIPETYSVSIQLRYVDNARSKGERPGVIDASNASVPKPAMALYQEASKLAEAKDYKGAIEKLKLAVVEYPKFVNALNQIGVLYLKLNELDHADEALRAALQIKSDAYEPLLNRGITLFRLARFKEAESVLRNALKAKAESAAAYYYLGRTLHKQGRTEEAEKAYLMCTKISPDGFKEAHRLLAAIYLDRGAFPRVVEELETYLRLAPDAVDSQNLRRIIEQIELASAPQPNRKPQD
jgi:tetratricopeptide (TPR) repeat protein